MMFFYIKKSTAILYSYFLMRKLFKEIWFILKETFSKFFSEDPMNYSASIAFYTIFSLPAVLIVVLSVAGSIYGEQAVSGQLYYQIEFFVGSDSARQIQSIIQNATLSDAGTIATAIGIATLLFSATTVFVAIQNGLNKIWGVKAKPKRGWVKFVINRMLSFVMVLFFGLVLLTSLLLEAGLEFFGELLRQYISGYTFYFMRIMNLVIFVIILSMVFSMVFKLLPDAVIRWRDVSVGAFVTAILFTIGRLLISLYLGNSDLGDTYGAAGSLVLILVWVYYSSTILLLGAQFTQVYSKRYGKIILPTSNAVRVIEKEVHPTDQEALKSI
ncbi:YihY/virulence factor BrkB family protein [soil metagenome]